jgi:hypothetical protein
MMVKVFVHEYGPLMRFEWSKERMGVSGGASCALSDKAIDRCEQLDALSLEVAFCRVRCEKFG